MKSAAEEMNKKMTNYIIRLLCALIAAVAIFTIIIVGNNSEMQSVIDNNITKLKKLENVSVARTQLIIKKTSHTTAKRKVDLAKVDFNKVFESCVLVGDSITEGAYEYKFLDKDVAVFKRGISIKSRTNDLTAKSITMNPGRIFLAYGLNDLEHYNGNAKAFVKAYSDLIKHYQKAIPKSKIYINSLLPATSAKEKKTPSLRYYAKFNAKLKKLCEKKAITFIDATYIPKRHPEYYEPDGQHFTISFYKLWLYNMGKKAGLM